ncbi:alpha/beta hydrolase [Lactococcus termiticola]|uniref:Acetylesterase n=1 Tax=Lactococcus termiticola TaxID=2169526 RepID=A0A2R5HF67_9LACT|nr:alpha/beta hydrolase family protein [Lactococcus termiticola]GBG96672.1 acetylesterase [Lactococcus termiticola]
MALLKIEYYSEVLEMNRQVNVIYPESSKVEAITKSDIPVLYLLHGMSGNENSWLQRSAIERLVRHSNLAIVMPSTDLGFYVNTTYGMHYYDAIAKELPQVIRNFFPNLSQKPEKNFIAGLSMGGYGAYRIALSSNYFSHAASLSGALSFEGMEAAQEANPAYWNGLFGSLEAFEQSDNNLNKLLKAPASKPKLYAWCGHQDYLYPANQAIAEKLQSAGFDLTYETADGTHEWYYWAKQIERVLEWLPIDYVKEERLS